MALPFGFIHQNFGLIPVPYAPLFKSLTLRLLMSCICIYIYIYIYIYGAPILDVSVFLDVRVLSGRGLCDELITRPEESYRPWCVVLCDLETSRIGAPYIYIYIYI